MFKRIDRSAFLSKVLDSTSDIVAKRRGLPIIIGIVLIIVSLILQTINVFAPSTVLELLGVLALHIGVLTALISSLLVVPLDG